MRGGEGEGEKRQGRKRRDFKWKERVGGVRGEMAEERREVVRVEKGGGEESPVCGRKGEGRGRGVGGGGEEWREKTVGGGWKGRGEREEERRNCKWKRVGGG